MSAVATALAVYSAQMLILVGVASPGRLPCETAAARRAAATTGGPCSGCACCCRPSRTSAPPPAARRRSRSRCCLAPAARSVPPCRRRGRRSLLAAVPWLAAAGAAMRLLWLAVGGVAPAATPAPQPAGAAGSELRRRRRRSLAPKPTCVLSDDIAQPVTFGWRRPIVLLPPRFDRLAAEAQHAVLCHELFHVRRRDWPVIVGEELLRAVLWFHPAVWWALEQVHLSREQVVDQPRRRAHVEPGVPTWTRSCSLPARGDAARPAIAFLRRRHLASRLRQLSKEPHMTRLRLVSAAATLLFVVTGTAVAVLSALPLDLPALGRQPGATTLEVRLAEAQPAAGLREAVLESGLRIYLRPEAVVTGADVTSAASWMPADATRSTSPSAPRLRTASPRPRRSTLDGRWRSCSTGR